jgi:hypothetical protein
MLLATRVWRARHVVALAPHLWPGLPRRRSGYFSRRSDDEGLVGLVGAGQGAGEVGAQAAAEHLVLSGGLDVA